MDATIVWEWLSFGLRWLHVVTGIAWIGSSFYFIALDLGLRAPPGLPAGVKGEEWQVHGGGFYHIRKYMVAPAEMPERLIWFKWESYATWLSGAALLAVTYWAGAELYMIDPAKADLSPVQAALISAASLGVGWVVYDRLCRSPLGETPTRLMLVLFGVLVAMSLLYDAVFTGRAALLHLGAFTATIMSANVFFVIIPNQKIVVADLRAGRTPDAKYGAIAKLRSTHNNYLTLPVLFLMLSNHYPLAFGAQHAWAIACLVFLTGVSIRHFFNTMHGGGGLLWWTWGVTAALFLAIMALSAAGPATPRDAAAALDPRAARLLAAAEFDAVRDVVLGRCSMCHAQEPLWEGIARAPKAVALESDADIARHAREVYLQAGRSAAMPPGNLTYMEPKERALLVAWYEGAR